MSALSVNDPEGPRSHRYYAPRQPRVVAREATLQPVLERLRGGARDYSADERLGDDADPLSSTQPEYVIVPERRFPFAALAAFAGGVTAVAALALGYVVFGTNAGSPVANAASVALASAQAPVAPAKIVALIMMAMLVSESGRNRSDGGGRVERRPPRCDRQTDRRRRLRSAAVALGPLEPIADAGGNRRHRSRAGCARCAVRSRACRRCCTAAAGCPAASSSAGAARGASRRIGPAPHPPSRSSGAPPGSP